jgi:cytochrome c oxidase subunit 4
MSDAHAPTHEDHGHGIGHITPVSLLLGVFAALIALTVLTVAVTYVDLGDANIWIALGVAVVKGGLVALYFMHLRYDSPFHGLILVSAFLFLAVFIGISLMDTGEYMPEQSPPSTVRPAAQPAG